MFVCDVCDKLEDSVDKLKLHLQRHSDVGELQLPLLCHVCNSSYNKLYNFIRHLKTYHDSNTPSADGTVVCETDMRDDETDVYTATAGDLCAADVRSVGDLFEDVTSEGVSLVASLRASSVPYSVVPNVVDSVNVMCGSLTSVIQAEALDIVASCVSPETADIFKEKLETNLQRFRTPLKFLNSRYKQDKYFDNHPMAVRPESIALGMTVESISGNSSLNYECFQYVPVEQTLRALFQNKDYVALLLNNKHDCELLQSYADGSQFKHHPLFSDSSKFSLAIQLFYDGLGVTNPLRGSSVLHNIGVFFYTIKNLSQQYNSCFANVHLLALCYSQDLKKYGFDPIIEKFVCEMNALSKHGFEGTFPIIGHCTVYASLCHVSCDNLALNGILGFIESFSCDYFCTLCYATQEQIQTTFCEDLFEMRTPSSYDRDLNRLCGGKGRNKLHCRGVKHRCKLNEIDGYHVTKNYSLDIMHVILEGIVPYELGCILYGLCQDVSELDMDTINRAVRIFWGKITVDKAHRPLEMNKLDHSGQCISPAMKAVQYWSLLKYLPLILGNRVSGSDHWEFLLHLSHLVDLLFAPSFTIGMVMYLKTVISDHLNMFVNLYSDGGRVRLRPKHHLLVHFPGIILKCGPLVGMSCMRYELKNAFFKRSAHIMCNFTDVCKTLAYRHQQRFLYSLLAKDYLRNVLVVTTHRILPVCTLTISDLLCEQFSVEATDDVAVATKINIASIQYNEGHFVVVDEDIFGLPQFGKIHSFVSCINSNAWHMVVEYWVTIEFCKHVHAFCVSKSAPAKFVLVEVSSLLDHHPLHCHTVTVPNGVGRDYIRLPYHVFRH